MSGFITIERKLWDHPLFMPSPMSEREAWMWMIAQAAWADTRHRVGSELVDVPRGSFMATLREMQSAFMWGSDKKVRTFLKTLEKEGMIGRTTRGAANAQKTHITICNYDEYQSRGRTKDAPRTQDGTHHGRTTDAVKEQGNKGTSRDTKVSLGDLGFSDFWKIWPSKKSKEPALKAWRKLTVEDRRAAFSAVRDGWFERWRESQPDANPIHAATFLNGKRWQDEFTDAQPTFKAINGGNYGKPAAKSNARVNAFVSGARGAS